MGGTLVLCTLMTAMFVHQDSSSFARFSPLPETAGSHSLASHALPEAAQTLKVSHKTFAKLAKVERANVKTAEAKTASILAAAASGSGSGSVSGSGSGSGKVIEKTDKFEVPILGTRRPTLEPTNTKH